MTPEWLRPRKWRPTLPHRGRPEHDPGHPVHVTWRILRGLPSLRTRALAGVVGRTVRAITLSHRARETSFRIIHFSIQSNHLHLIVEAGDKRALIGGLRGLAIWIARRVNAHLGAQGRVIADRYHARSLTTARQVRAAIVYVLHNHKHHQPSRFAIDECSSGPWFDGWACPIVKPATVSPVSEAGTVLGGKAWRAYGPIRLDEEPAPKMLL